MAEAMMNTGITACTSSIGAPSSRDSDQKAGNRMSQEKAPMARRRPQKVTRKRSDMSALMTEAFSLGQP